MAEPKPGERIDDVLSPEDVAAFRDDPTSIVTPGQLADWGLPADTPVSAIQVGDDGSITFLGTGAKEFQGFDNTLEARRDAINKGFLPSAIQTYIGSNGRVFAAIVEDSSGSFSQLRDTNTGDVLSFDHRTGDVVRNPDGTPKIIIPGTSETIPFTPPPAFETEAEAAAFIKANDRGATHEVALLPTGGFQVVRKPAAPGDFLDVQDLPGTGQVLITLTDGEQFRAAKKDEPVGPGAFQSAEDIEGTNETLITLTNGEQFRATKAGDATVKFNAEVGRFQITQSNGVVSFVSKERETQLPKSLSVGGRDVLFNPNTGSFQVLERQFEPGVVVEGGREFIQQPGGQLTPLPPEETRSIHDLIDERLAAGDAVGALALADFRDRPDSLELARFALQVVQSPGDQLVISNIARGQTLVQPPAQGDIRRVAPVPEFLQDATSRLLNAMRTGSATSGELFNVVDRIAREEQQTKKDLAAREKERDDALVQLKQAETDAKIKELMEQITGGMGGGAAQGAAEAIISDPQPVLTAKNQLVGAGLLTADEADAIISAQSAAGTSPEGIAAQLFGVAKRAAAAAEAAAIPPGGGVTAPAKGPPPTAPDPFPSKPQPTQPMQPFVPFEPDVPPTPTTPFMQFTPDVAPAAPAPGPVAPIEFTREAFAAEGGFTERELESIFGSRALAHGGMAGHGLELVGEDGPELVDLAPGTRVIPLKKVAKKDLAKMRKALGITGFQEGGTVEPLLPFGVRQALAGAAIEPPRGRLSTAAGLPILSAQARRNLLPEELEVFNRLSREAGIPTGAFEQEQRAAIPGFSRIGRARFAPQVLR
jgi:hypothetical protein